MGLEKKMAAAIAAVMNSLKAKKKWSPHRPWPDAVPGSRLPHRLRSTCGD